MVGFDLGLRSKDACIEFENSECTLVLDAQSVRNTRDSKNSLSPDCQTLNSKGQIWVKWWLAKKTQKYEQENKWGFIVRRKGETGKYRIQKSSADEDLLIGQKKSK